MDRIDRIRTNDERGTLSDELKNSRLSVPRSSFRLPRFIILYILSIPV